MYTASSSVTGSGISSEHTTLASLTARSSSDDSAWANDRSRVAYLASGTLLTKNTPSY